METRQKLLATTMKHITSVDVELTRTLAIENLHQCSQKMEKILRKYQKQIQNDVKQKNPNSIKMVEVTLNNENMCKLSIPEFIVVTCNYLRPHLHVEGLFRRSGCLTTQEKLKKTLEKSSYNYSSVVFLEMKPSIHDVACLLKHYLRDVLQPIIPLCLHDIFNMCLNSTDKIDYILTTSLLIPVDNLSVLTYLVHFFYDVAKLSQKNKMDFHNLAIVMAPNLMPKGEGSENYKKMNSSDQLVNNLAHHISVVEILFRNYEKVGMLYGVLEKHYEILAEKQINYQPNSYSEVIKQRGRSRIKVKSDKTRSGSLSRVLVGVKNMITKTPVCKRSVSVHSTCVTSHESNDSCPQLKRKCSDSIEYLDSNNQIKQKENDFPFTPNMRSRPFNLSAKKIKRMATLGRNDRKKKGDTLKPQQQFFESPSLLQPEILVSSVSKNKFTKNKPFLISIEHSHNLKLSSNEKYSRDDVQKNKKIHSKEYFNPRASHDHRNYVKNSYLDKKFELCSIKCSAQGEDLNASSENEDLLHYKSKSLLSSQPVSNNESPIKGKKTIAQKKNFTKSKSQKNIHTYCSKNLEQQETKNYSTTFLPIAINDHLNEIENESKINELILIKNLSSSPNNLSQKTKSCMEDQAKQFKKNSQEFKEQDEKDLLVISTPKLSKSFKNVDLSDIIDSDNSFENISQIDVLKNLSEHEASIKGLRSNIISLIQDSFKESDSTNSDSKCDNKSREEEFYEEVFKDKSSEKLSCNISKPPTKSIVKEIINKLEIVSVCSPDDNNRKNSSDSEFCDLGVENFDDKSKQFLKEHEFINKSDVANNFQRHKVRSSLRRRSSVRELISKIEKDVAKNVSSNISRKLIHPQTATHSSSCYQIHEGEEDQVSKTWTDAKNYFKLHEINNETGLRTERSSIVQIREKNRGKVSKSIEMFMQNYGNENKDFVLQGKTSKPIELFKGSKKVEIQNTYEINSTNGSKSNTGSENSIIKSSLEDQTTSNPQLKVNSKEIVRTVPINNVDKNQFSTKKKDLDKKSKRRLRRSKRVAERRHITVIGNPGEIQNPLRQTQNIQSSLNIQRSNSDQSHKIQRNPMKTLSLSNASELGVQDFTKYNRKRSRISKSQILASNSVNKAKNLDSFSNSSVGQSVKTRISSNYNNILKSEICSFRY